MEANGKGPVLDVTERDKTGRSLARVCELSENQIDHPCCKTQHLKCM